jgi:hypothetical protein
MSKSRNVRLTVDALTKRGATKAVMLLIQAKVRRIGRDVAGVMVSKALLSDLREALIAVAERLWASGQGGLETVDFLVVDILPGDADGMMGAALWLVPRDGKSLSKQVMRVVHQGVCKALQFLEARSLVATEDMFAPSRDAPDWFLADDAWHRALAPISRAARRGKQPLHLICEDGPVEMLSPTPIPPSQPELVRQISIYGVVDAFKRSKAWMQIQGHEGEAPTSLAAEQRTFLVSVPLGKGKVVTSALDDERPRYWRANVIRIRKDGSRETLTYVLS